jgi:hypothetical protein
LRAWRASPDERSRRGHPLVVEAHPARKPALVGQASLHDHPQLILTKRLEAVDAKAREEWRVELIIGVLGGRTDEGDRPVLDVGQQRVLLRLVEAVDLVDEDHGHDATRASCPRIGEQLSQVGNAAGDGADLVPRAAGPFGQQARQGGLA